MEVYKSDEEGKILSLTEIENRCWINLVGPTEEEIKKVSKEINVPIEFIKAALDEEETSRIETEDNNTLIVLDIPFAEKGSLIYETIPLGIIHTSNNIITICLKQSNIFKDFKEGKIASFYTFKKSRFILQILYKVAKLYLRYLKQIDRQSSLVERRLHRSMKNKELIQLLNLEKTLVYFSTSLKGNEITLEKMLKLQIIQKYEDDKELLEDVIIENKQAIEMCNIYSNILSGTMDAFASVISNNLNIVMKFLAAITIVMAIPNMISGLFGMNLKGMPFYNAPFGFWYVIAIVAVLSIIVTILLYKKDMF